MPSADGRKEMIRTSRLIGWPAKSWTVAKHTWLPLGFREESGSAPVELGETCLEVTDDRAESA